ncbi:hypothetical protein [Phaeobacter sp. 11ANDIMAR09]|uniref:hypothetical protein n=1 Tax=Phaeobacter sp. 11ANDIMAR09 TaxID=1225647 RepID=UPI0006C84AEE|nr:hypothetical protein [Phaeobacter sp. 11ANDIMAR09]KPD11940.1 hypothetical protein AN476_13260 [Phaeobacter sp. 11ANDIMAR09]OIQ33019.1 MAG: hypothetical protein BM559_10585 [Roseobacter sp. MedPE-SWchi]
MGTIEKLGEKLAVDTLKVQDAIGEDRFYMEVAQVLGAASQSLEEAFLTEIRVRLAERKAREFIADKLAQVQSELEEKAKR